jgi:uncharacterized protein YjbI with pentapeptide repeats
VTASADYHGQDLRGESFRGKNLDGADFSEADLRGTDFSNASLVEADFSNARLGVGPLTASLILLGALAVSIAAGVAVGLFAETTRQQAGSSDWRDVFAGVLMATVTVLFLALLIFKGISKALRAFVIAIVAIVILDFTVVYILAGELRFQNAVPLIGLLVLVVPAATAGILGRMVGGTFGAWAIGIIAAVGGLAAGRAHGGIAAVAVSVLLVVISKRALSGDIRDGPMRYIGHRIASHRGTKFTGADLTGADFTGTRLVHSDMSSAIVEGATWETGQQPYIHNTSD